MTKRARDHASESFCDNNVESKYNLDQIKAVNTSQKNFWANLIHTNNGSKSISLSSRNWRETETKTPSWRTRLISQSSRGF